jgi:ABC-2 type transport system ATP-binding protein
MIKIEGLTKRYGKFEAVNNIDLHVRPGEVFGFLGPNGAGKTTTLKMIAGLLKPTQGSVIIADIDTAVDPVGAKRVIGYIPDRPYLYEKLTAREFLAFIGGIYGVPDKHVASRTVELLDTFGLTRFTDELVEAFSHGMKQRLTLCAALLHHPRLLVVDEPMVGLDPAGAKLIKQVFRGMAAEGRTVFLSTHTLDVAEAICDRVAIIDHGKIVTLGTVDELKALHTQGSGRLEDVFMELVGRPEDRDVVAILRGTADA